MELPVAKFWSTAARCGVQTPSREPRVECGGEGGGCVLVFTWLSSDLPGRSGAIEGNT